MAPWLGWGATSDLGQSKRQVAGPEGSGVCSRQRQPGPIRVHRTPQERPMGAPRILTLICCAFLASWAGGTGFSQSGSGTSAGQEQVPAGKQASSKEAQVGVPTLPRGKKLVLKDGTFQLVRDYRRNGERVRYLSAERGDWADIPSAMGCCDAPANAATAEQGE